MTQAGKLPYWRLSAFYFCHFAVMGALVPYLPAYLAQLGLAPAQIGSLMAIHMGMRLISPNIWGYVADRRGQILSTIRWGAALAAFSFLGMFGTHDVLHLAWVIGLFSFFWHACLPPFEALTLSYLGAAGHRYPLVRLWGSVGFIATVAGFGAFGERAIAYLPYVLAPLFFAIWAAACQVPAVAVRVKGEVSTSFLQVLRQPPVLGFLTTCFLLNLSHGPYYTFFTLYLQALGYRQQLIGGLWAWAVLAEVGLFVLLPRLRRRWQPRALFLGALGLTVLRWVLIAILARYPLALILAQALHAASFAVCHAMAVGYIQQFFSPAQQGRAQGLYSSVAFGGGSALGSLVSGFLWPYGGGFVIYLGAAGVAWVALVLAWLSLPPAHPQQASGLTRAA